MTDPGLQRLAAWAALAAALSGLLYSVCFVIVSPSNPAAGAAGSGLFLLPGGLLSVAAFAGVFLVGGVVRGGLGRMAYLIWPSSAWLACSCSRRRTRPCRFRARCWASS